MKSFPQANAAGLGFTWGACARSSGLGFARLVGTKGLEGGRLHVFLFGRERLIKYHVRNGRKEKVDKLTLSRDSTKTSPGDLSVALERVFDFKHASLALRAWRPLHLLLKLHPLHLRTPKSVMK